MAGLPSHHVRFDVESLDYDIDASTLFERKVHERSAFLRRYNKILRWIICMAVGCTTGLVAFTLDVLGSKLLALKFALSARAMAPTSGDVASAWFRAFFTHTVLSLALVAVAAILVIWVAPIAGGSGIPEVKAYLQGIKVPGMLRTGVLLAKVVGVLCSVTGGLVVGKEGPMIHTGAIIAAGISQGSSKTCRLRTMWLKTFRNDHDKRDFVSAGAAAGVAAAFGAPIGGVLFAMEEAASYWSQSLTWRTFFCAICSTVTLNLLLSAAEQHFGELSHPGLITFGSFLGQSHSGAYQLQELPIFALLGVAGGLLGSLFNFLNRKITIWRSRNFTAPSTKFLEAMAITVLTALCCFTLPLLVPCTDAPDAPEPDAAPDDVQAARVHPRESDLANAMHRLLCGNNHQRSNLGSLMLSSHEDAIKILFHQTALPGVTNISMSLLYFGFSFIVGLLTYGVAIPSGLFVPAIMAGAALGRLVGELITRYAPGFSNSDPGSYALMGAAAMLGGICRMTISITVIVVESTTSLSYLLPIALVITTAKLIGDMFNEGIYDLHMELKRYPILPDQPPPRRERLQARQIMSPEVKTVCEVEQVGTLLKLLRTTPHNGFPVVARGGGAHARVLGVITRDQLLIILSKRQFNRRQLPGRAGGSLSNGIGSTSPPLSADDFLRPWFNDFEVDKMRFSADELEQTVTLSPYVNEAALVTLQNTSLRRVSTLFRSMGLRHLLVVEQCPKVVGIITRKDIIMGGEEHLRPDVSADISVSASVSHTLVESYSRPSPLSALLSNCYAGARRRARRAVGRMHAQRAMLPPLLSRSDMPGSAAPWLRNSPPSHRNGESTQSTSLILDAAPVAPAEEGTSPFGIMPPAGAPHSPFTTRKKPADAALVISPNSDDAM